MPSLFNYTVTIPDLVLLLLFMLATLCAAVIAYRKVSLQSRYDVILQEAQKRLGEKEEQLNRLNYSLKEKEQYVYSLQRSLAVMEETRNNLSDENDKLIKETDLLNSDLKEQISENTQLSRDNAVLKANFAALKQQMEANKVQFEQNYQELEQKLTVLGERMLKERSQALQESSKEQFKNAVSPLKEELETFREFLTQSQKTSSEQSGALGNELKKLQEAQVSLSKQADELTSALRSGGKSQGMWGELQLERVLDASGLTKGIEYEREFFVKDRENRGRPDAVIKLPENHCIIIDAKCSLTAYTAYINAGDESTQKSSLSAHIASIRNHLTGLSKRSYENYQQLFSPSFVFMFVPIDSALTLALRHDSALYSQAAAQNVYLVSPSTLIPALRVVSSLWMLANQNERMQQLALDAQNICRKFDNVTDALSEVLDRQSKLNDSISVLDRRLVSGRGALKTQLENFKNRAPVISAQNTDSGSEIFRLEDTVQSVSANDTALLSEEKLLTREDKS